MKKRRFVSKIHTVSKHLVAKTRVRLEGVYPAPDTIYSKFFSVVPMLVSLIYEIQKSETIMPIYQPRPRRQFHGLCELEV